MPKPTMLVPTPAPHINCALVSEEQRDSCRVIANTLASLDQYTLDFWAGLTLFDAALHWIEVCTEKLSNDAHDEESENGREIWGRWKFLAARDACMSIYHFGRARDGLHETLGTCDDLRNRLDRGNLRAANKLFDAQFPDYIKMRHAIAHAAETKSTPKAEKKHAFQDDETEIVPGIKIKSSDGGKIMFSNTLWDRTYQSMWEGVVVTTDIVPDTGKRLAEVRDAYYAVFSAATA